MTLRALDGQLAPIMRLAEHLAPRRTSRAAGLRSCPSAESAAMVNSLVEAGDGEGGNGKAGGGDGDGDGADADNPW